MCRRAELVLALLLVLPLALTAQERPSTNSPVLARKQATAVQVPEGSIRLDGRLSEGAWNLAPPIADFIHPQDDEVTRDDGFEPVWEAKVAIDETGWTAELWIPLSQLRFNNRPEQVWGLNIKRFTPTSNEYDYWVVACMRKLLTILNAMISRTLSKVAVSLPPSRMMGRTFCRSCPSRSDSRSDSRACIQLMFPRNVLDERLST